MAKVKVMESGCQEWQSTMHRDGYGKMWLNGQNVQAHRAAWRIFRGEIPKGMQVCHTCDNRRCVSLNHLYLGTASDNARDKVERFQGLWGRMKYGPEVHEQVFRLRAQGLTQEAIAGRTGVDQTTVSRMVRRATLISQRINP